MRKHWKLLLGTALLAGAATAATASVPAQATAPTRATAVQRQTAADRAQQRHELALLDARGATDAQIKAQLGLVRVDDATARRVLAPASRTAVAVSTPKIYYEQAGPTHDAYYAAVATWKFSGDPDGADCSFGDTCNIGGEDGFGISFSRQIRNDGATLDICPTTTKYGLKCFYAANYATNNAYGAGWKFQDKERGSSKSLFNDGLPFFNAHAGEAIFDFVPLSSGCLQAFSSYGHSWDTTRLTSIGIGVSTSGASVSFGWTRDDHEWDRASGGGQLHCG